MTRVVVTGMGALTHLGIGHEDLNEGTFNLQGHPPSTWLSSEGGLELQGYLIDDKDLAFKEQLAPFKTRNMDRFAKLSIAAVAVGIQDSGLSADELVDTGFIMNTTFGPWESTNRYTKELVASGPTYASPRLFPNTVVNSAQGHVCISFNMQGPTSTLAGVSSIPYAIGLIQKGATDRVIVAGADEANENVMEAFQQSSSQVTFGEGVGVLVLESLERAIDRGATIYGEIIDYSIGCEPSMHLLFDDGDEGTDLFERLVGRLDVKEAINELAVISAENGARAIESMEQRLIDQLRAEYKTVRVFQPKRVYGETFGASSILSTINGLHVLHPDGSTDGALILNSEIGGNHMVLALKKWHGEVN